MVLIGEEKKYSRDSSQVPPKRSQGIHSQPQNPGFLVSWDKDKAKICSAHQHRSPLFTPWWWCRQPGTGPWHRPWGQLESSLSCSSHITWCLRWSLWNISKHHPFLSSSRQATVSHQALCTSQLDSQLASQQDFWSSLCSQSDGSKPQKGSHQPLLRKHQLDPYWQRKRFRTPSMTMRASAIWSRPPSGPNSTPLKVRFRRTRWIQRLRGWRKGVKDNSSNHIQKLQIASSGEQV